MPMSRRITSGRNSAASSTACMPSRTVRTSLPIKRNIVPMLSAASTLSSATRIRHFAALAVGAPPSSSRDCGEGIATAGRLTMNSAPVPGPPLRASTVPPCISTSRFTSVRPMPKPPWLFSSERSTCVNISKIDVSAFAGMPTPVSRTLKRISPLRCSAVNHMRPPRSM